MKHYLRVKDLFAPGWKSSSKLKVLTEISSYIVCVSYLERERKRELGRVRARLINSYSNIFYSSLN